MKRTHVAIAILSTLAALTSTAYAQSSVQVYGSVDAGLRTMSNTNEAGDSRLVMGSNGTFRSNRLGFKGSEDLGDGLAANFVLEMGFNTATGALNNTTNSLFQREARVGLSGSYGELNLGRQYTVAYKTILAFDPFGFRYPSLTYALSSTAGTRLSNDVQYSKKLGDFTVRAEYALGEVAGNTSALATQAVGANYASGPLKLGVSYSTSKQNAGTTAAPNYKDYTHLAAGGAYDFGRVTAFVGYVDEKQATLTVDDTSKWQWVGLSVEAAPQIEVNFAWYQVKVFNTRGTAALAAGEGKKDLYMLGATYALSQRTTLYAEYDVTRLAGSNATGGTTKLNQKQQNGISAGIQHNF